jgi:hypothetical protein
VLVVDNASWHQGSAIDELLKGFPHLELYPLPSYSPQLQVIERFWKMLRRRATHNQLFQTMTQLKQTLRNSLCCYQTLKYRVLSVIQARRSGTKLSAARIAMGAWIAYLMDINISYGYKYILWIYFNGSTGPRFLIIFT